MTDTARTTTTTATLGALAPDFDLPSSLGPVRLSALRGHPVVVYFMREFSCPMCQGHVRTIRRLARELPAARFLVVGGGTPDDALALARRFSLDVPVLADETRAVYAAYDLGRALGVWQRSGTAVIDRAGVLRAFSASHNPQAAFSADELSRVIGTL